MATLAEKLAKAEKEFEDTRATLKTTNTVDNKEAMLRAEVAVKEIEYKIKEAELKALVDGGIGAEDLRFKVANKALDDAREERNKAEARLDVL